MARFSGLRGMFSRQVVICTYEPSLGTIVEDIETAKLYAGQPNLRAVVSFLADNAAMIPWKVFSQDAEGNRERVRDSAAALLLDRPNAWTTQFELKRGIFCDMLLYGRCLVLTLRDDESPSGWQLVRIPPTWISGYRGISLFEPDEIDIVPRVSGAASKGVTVKRGEFVLFHGYDPNDPSRASSPIEALKDTLSEQIESNVFRRQMWKRGGRFNAYVMRPKEVEPLDDVSFNRLKDTFKNSWAGDAAAEGGGMPILEDGMEIKQVQFNSRDAQWTEAKRLGRQDVAGVYHVNPALIWPGNGGQTYASAKDNARALYNDTLAPYLMEVVSRISTFLLPIIGEDSSHYVEYDLTVKTQGSFEERAAIMQSAVGGPWLTRDEARAQFNLPPIAGADELIVPLNVVAGGLASPRDTDPTRGYSAAQPMDKARGRKSRAHPNDDEADDMAKCFKAFFARQRKSVLPKLSTKSDDGWWDGERWDRELADDLYKLGIFASTSAALRALGDLGIPSQGYSAKRTEGYIRKMCQTRAHAVNAATKRELDAALDPDYDGDVTPESVFDVAEDSRAEKAGVSIATAIAGWAALEAVRQCAPSAGILKTWIVTSDNPRPTHAAMDGETVPRDQPFSNGAMWPGDTGNLTADEVVNCQCEVELTYPD